MIFGEWQQILLLNKLHKQVVVVSNKSTLEKIHGYENLVVDVLNKRSENVRVLQVNVLLEKFPPSWTSSGIIFL